MNELLINEYKTIYFLCHSRLPAITQNGDYYIKFSIPVLWHEICMSLTEEGRAAFSEYRDRMRHLFVE